MRRLRRQRDRLKLLTLSEVSKRRRISRQTLWRLRATGAIPMVRLDGSRRVFVRESTLEAIIRVGRATAFEPGRKTA
jgi:hypothetical protein